MTQNEMTTYTVDLKNMLESLGFKYIKEGMNNNNRTLLVYDELVVIFEPKAPKITIKKYKSELPYSLRIRKSTYNFYKEHYDNDEFFQLSTTNEGTDILKIIYDNCDVKELILLLYAACTENIR